MLPWKKSSQIEGKIWIDHKLPRSFSWLPLTCHYLIQRSFCVAKLRDDEQEVPIITAFGQSSVQVGTTWCCSIASWNQINDGTTGLFHWKFDQWKTGNLENSIMSGDYGWHPIYKQDRTRLGMISSSRFLIYDNVPWQFMSSLLNSSCSWSVRCLELAK